MQNNSYVTIGYIVSFLPYFLLPVVFIPLGVIISFVNIFNNKAGHGLIQLIITLAMGTVGAMGGWGFGLPKLRFQ